MAQTKAVTGDINFNIEDHKKFINLAAFHSADAIIFPELSLTGYEPSLANELATNQVDERFNGLQELSDSKKIIIGAGMPIKSNDGVLIGMILFQPDQARQTYFKQHLHADEQPYFINGTSQPGLRAYKISLAICYEISIPGHAKQAHKDGAEIYIASVAKTVDGMNRAVETLSATAKKFSMTVLLSNCVGECEGKKAGGRSSVWNNKGNLLAQLDDTNEGLLIFDTHTEQIIQEQKKYSFSK